MVFCRIGRYWNLKGIVYENRDLSGRTAADELSGRSSAAFGRRAFVCAAVQRPAADGGQCGSGSGKGCLLFGQLPGQLLGLLVMGAQEIAEIAKELDVPEEKSVLLRHLVLSHHGEPEFGAAVRPQCAESELLSCIDTIDSRMEIYRETYEALEPGTFSPRIFALERRVYKHN